jgi:L-cysteate sulfo-lyase
MMDDVLHLFDKLPRIPLAHLPTPIDFLPALSVHLGGPAIYVKRDDQTGLATGGNKTRKLEFLIAQAIEAGANCVITAGSTQSNHARQTAAAARRAGLEPHLVLYAPGGSPPAEPEGNLLLDALLGAVVHWTEESAPYAETIARVEADLRAADRKPYVIPYGGSNAYGAAAYALAMLEAHRQLEKMGAVDAHVFASSSGGTQAGMLLGAHLLADETPVIGISVDEKADVLAERVARLAGEGAALLGVDWTPDAGSVRVEDGYLGRGYAVVGDREREALRLLARYEGLLADPVYTGRAFGGLVDLIRKRRFAPGQRILFWHTGGTAALWAFADDLLLQL